ncbi:MAG: hypothetical protein KA388_03245 [Rhodocyclaceae bacterium]|nr:hypothetical protein [Rhodocyclaceae bacterium]MBP6109918.1 hypothetical protein [Rhodocyclaceae bacterium]MBP6278753.1 hypothetical protein [Rhodocyclaceae bacterium]
MALLSQQKSRFGSSLMQRKSLALLCSVMFSLGAASTAQAQQDKDILALFDQGEALRSQGAFLESRNIWLQADDQVRLWEESIKTNGSKILGDIGSYILNDTTRRYEGRDYEKVFLSVRLAMNHLALGEWDSARTEVKKMHEREAVIAEFRAKELDATKREAEAKGLKTTSFKELNGYPIETLEDPAVRALKNSYESAHANYLAGFVYEALGEPSLAAAGYRKAAEMQPNRKTIDDSLAGLDQRVASARSNRKTVDVLLVVESGSPPEITSTTIPIPIPIIGRSGVNIVATPLSWPVVQPVNVNDVPNVANVDGNAVPLTLLTNVDLMARRALSDEMPGIIFRSGVRAITKGIAQKAVQDNSSSLGMFGAVLSIAASAVAVATEKADTRSWRSMPGFYSVARVTLPVGVHKFGIGPDAQEVKISGPYAVVALRSNGRSGGMSLAASPYVEPPPEPVAVPEPVVVPAPVVEDKKPAPVKAPEKKKKG